MTKATPKRAVAKAPPKAMTPAELLSVAVTQGAELDKLERLMALQERWEKSEAEKAYITAMSRFRAECPTIKKTRQAHNAKYAGLAESIDQVKDLLAECGLSHSWTTQQQDSTITVTCTVRHIQGHGESTTLSAAPDTSGSKNSIQAIGSTVSYLQRYTLFAILGLASTDQDTDGHMVSNALMHDLDTIMSADKQTLRDAVRTAWDKWPEAKERQMITKAKEQRVAELSEEAY